MKSYTLNISLRHKGAIVPVALARGLLSSHPRYRYKIHMEKLYLCFQGSVAPKGKINVQNQEMTFGSPEFPSCL